MFAAAILSCNGYHPSHKTSAPCRIKLSLDKNRQSINFSWNPLQASEGPAWAGNRRNWCTLEIRNEKLMAVIQSSKLEPKICDKLIKHFSDAFQKFPNAEAKAEIEAEPLTSSRHSAFGELSASVANKQELVQLEDLASCKMQMTQKKKKVHCPVLVPLVYSWLGKFLAELGIVLEIRNFIK